MSSTPKNKSSKKILAIYLLDQAGETIAFESQLKIINKHFDLDVVRISPPNLDWDNAKPFQLFKHYLASYKEYVNVARTKLKKHSYDLLLTTILPLPLMANIVARNKKFKTIYFFHGSKHPSLINEARNKKYSILKKILYIIPIRITISLIEQFSGAFIELIVLPSNSALNFLPFHLMQLNKKSTVIYHYIDKLLPFNKKSSITKPFKICYFGRLSREKGVDSLIKSFEHLSPHMYELNLFCLSSNDQKFNQQIVKLIANRTNMKLVFNLPKKKLMSALKKQHLCVLPSKQELLPISYLESLSSGVPMITTKVGDLTNLQTKIEPSLLLKNTHSKTIADRIKWYFHLSKSEQKRIFINSNSLLSRFNSKKVRHKIIKTINEV